MPCPAAGCSCQFSASDLNLVVGEPPRLARCNAVDMSLCECGHLARDHTHMRDTLPPIQSPNGKMNIREKGTPSSPGNAVANTHSGKDRENPNDVSVASDDVDRLTQLDKQLYFAQNALLQARQALHLANPALFPQPGAMDGFAEALLRNLPPPVSVKSGPNAVSAEDHTDYAAAEDTVHVNIRGTVPRKLVKHKAGRDSDGTGYALDPNEVPSAFVKDNPVSETEDPHTAQENKGDSLGGDHGPVMGADSVRCKYRIGLRPVSAAMVREPHRKKKQDRFAEVQWYRSFRSSSPEKRRDILGEARCLRPARPTSPELERKLRQRVRPATAAASRLRGDGAYSGASNGASNGAYSGGNPMDEAGEYKWIAKPSMSSTSTMVLESALPGRGRGLGSSHKGVEEAIQMDDGGASMGGFGHDGENERQHVHVHTQGSQDRNSVDPPQRVTRSGSDGSIGSRGSTSKQYPQTRMGSTAAAASAAAALELVVAAEAAEAAGGGIVEVPVPALGDDINVKLDGNGENGIATGLSEDDVTVSAVPNVVEGPPNNVNKGTDKETAGGQEPCDNPNDDNGNDLQVGVGVGVGVGVEREDETLVVEQSVAGSVPPTPMARNTQRTPHATQSTPSMLPPRSPVPTSPLVLPNSTAKSQNRRSSHDSTSNDDSSAVCERDTSSHHNSRYGRAKWLHQVPSSTSPSQSSAGSRSSSIDRDLQYDVHGNVIHSSGQLRTEPYDLRPRVAHKYVADPTSLVGVGLSTIGRERPWSANPLVNRARPWPPGYMDHQSNGNRELERELDGTAVPLRQGFALLGHQSASITAGVIALSRSQEDSDDTGVGCTWGGYVSDSHHDNAYEDAIIEIGAIDAMNNAPSIPEIEASTIEVSQGRAATQSEVEVNGRSNDLVQQSASPSNGLKEKSASQPSQPQVEASTGPTGPSDEGGVVDVDTSTVLVSSEPAIAIGTV